MKDPTRTWLPSTTYTVLTPASEKSRLRVLALTLLLVLTGCATASFNPATAQSWLQDGTLALMRPVPKQNMYAQNFQSEPMARMRPPEQEQPISPPHLVVHGASHSLTLSLPGSAPVTVKAQGTYALKPGSYKVALKQTEPLWYAPPTYYLRRGIQVPADGSKARYMRGALGSKAIFLDREIPIHSGPVWTEEIGGLRLSEEDMARIFDAVAVGGRVEVR
jgi:hypothetical protein